MIRFLTKSSHDSCKVRNVLTRHHVSSKVYDPKEVESGRYEKWKGLSKSASSSESYSMILPPPNVTGRLHVGHALTLAIQDCFVRFQRMKGKTVNWIPGLDHAGIATQSVVERHLKKTSNLTRQDMSREQFLEHVWDWTNSNGGHIEKQIRSLGALLDWKREFFTLDKARSEAVTEAFVRLYDAGLIYRGERMVHWCPHLRTVISDIEIEYEDLTDCGPRALQLPNNNNVEFGYIHHFEYQIMDSDQKIEVATTRLETMLGDVAIAVHPEDSRWCSYIGKFAIHPFRPGHLMPIVGDETLVDMTTGTGAVKLTPAHDPNDFEAAKRHDLPVHPILDLNARITNLVKRYEGRDRFEVRDMLENDLTEKGLYKGKKRHEMRVARCSRSGDVLEPMLLPQWYVRTDEMARESVSHIENGVMNMIPKSLEKEWRRWLEHPQDWCISRQLVWGHRIPAWRVVGHGDMFVVGRHIEEATKRAQEKLNTSKDVKLEQDEDVLDTWFSSGLLPLSANGWPHNLDNDSYPLDLMETGSDILFFWVARMSMLCTYLDGRPPFRNVYCHSLVRDRYGRKMSKSLGNVILPEYIIEGRELKDLLQDLKNGNLSDKELSRSLKETKKEFPNGIEACGTDALRLALLLQGERPHLDASEVLQCRHFCNKLWQASRFTTLLRERAGDFIQNNDDDNNNTEKSLLQRWIHSRLAYVVDEVNDSLNAYDAARAAHTLRTFIQNEFCSVFIEFAKPTQYKESCDLAGNLNVTSQVASQVLDCSLKLLHPFMPYVTEALYEHTSFDVEKEESIMLTHFPKQSSMMRDTKAEQDMTKLLDTLRAIRSVRKRASEIGLTQESLGKIRVVVVNEQDENFLRLYSDALLAQCKGVSVLEISESKEGEELECSLVSSVPSLCRVYLDLEKSADAMERMDKELNRIEKKSKKLQKKHDRVLKSYEKSSSSKTSVPEHVLETQRKDLSDLREQLDALSDSESSVRDVLRMFSE